MNFKRSIRVAVEAGIVGVGVVFHKGHMCLRSALSHIRQRECYCWWSIQTHVVFIHHIASIFTVTVQTPDYHCSMSLLCLIKADIVTVGAGKGGVDGSLHELGIGVRVALATL